MAVENENLEIVKLLLADKNIDVNAPKIPKFIFFKIQDRMFWLDPKSKYSIEFEIIIFNRIQNPNVQLYLKQQSIQYDSKLKYSIGFKIKIFNYI